MPVKSKISGTRPGASSKQQNDRPEYHCCRCRRAPYQRQKGNFPAAQSALYENNNGYLPICRHCLEDLFIHYKGILGEEGAIRRLCMKFDIYWHEDVYKMLNKASTTQSRILAYISKSNLYQFAGKTYDDTLDEEYARQLKEGAQVITELPDPDDDEASANLESVLFWGTGFKAEEYEELDTRFRKWASGYECKTVAEENLLKQIVLTDWRITKETQKGAKTDGLINAYNALLGSANLKPVQNKEATLAEGDNTFGTLIKVWENERPIPEPEKEWEDVDGIIKYINIWFLGHLCKMMKINNSYSRLYEQEMAKFRVEKPEYEGEDEELMFDNLFGGENNQS